MSEDKPKRKFVGVKNISEKSSSLILKNKRVANRLITHIPEDILNDPELNEAIKLLPSNYNFEIHKTVWNIRKNNAKKIALQMPEGLLIYSLVISDILKKFAGNKPDENSNSEREEVEVLVMGDVSYGACCIDDFTARSLNCDYIVHYAHSCLVPIDVTQIKVLYIFVTINIDISHLYNTIVKNFSGEKLSGVDVPLKIAMFGTIQFNPSIHDLKERFEKDVSNNIHVIPPQISPLSKGEVLGCTSQKLNSEDIDLMIYLGDGRFHLESAMIHNPQIPAFRYDPYSRKFTKEGYDMKQMTKMRMNSLEEARAKSRTGKVGLILGGLGRQGNTTTVKNLQSILQKNNKVPVKIILSEIFPGKLAMFDDIDFFVQVACPRLSIDWGYAFNRPLLNPYECMVLFNEDTPFNEDYYPMDYYGRDGYGRGQIPHR